MENLIEQQFISLCAEFKIKYTRPEREGGRLDFYLPEFNLHVEVKSYSTPRLHEQLESVQAGPNHPVLVLVGADSVKRLRELFLAAVVEYWMEATPVVPRRPLDDKKPAVCTHAGVVSQEECPYCNEVRYMESDKDFVLNNIDAAVRLLELEFAVQKLARRPKGGD